MSLIKIDISSTYSLSKYWILLYENYKWNFDYQQNYNMAKSYMKKL